jgi:peptidoglycan/LPS O-acetylase OafA/YrhL
VGASLVRWNFHVAVWLTIVGGFFLLFFLDPHDVGPGKAVLQPPTGVAILAAMQLLSWFWAYRRGEGQGIAGAIAGGFLIQIIAAFILPQVNDEPVNFKLVGVAAYFALSHGVYALRGWRPRPRSALDL